VKIVNCARGGLVDEAALRKLLDEGHIGGAAFDVFVEEPAKENVLFGAENFIATPHLGASTAEAQENVALQVAEQMSDYLLTGAVTNALNSPSVTAEEAPRLAPFVALAGKLGVFAGQMVDFGVKAIDIAYEGEVSKLNAKPLTAAALAGVLGAVHLLLLADHWLLLIAAWAAVGLVMQTLLCFYPERPFAQLAAHKKRLADLLAWALLAVAAGLAWSEVGSGSLSDLARHLAQGPALGGPPFKPFLDHQTRRGVGDFFAQRCVHESGRQRRSPHCARDP